MITKVLLISISAKKILPVLTFVFLFLSILFVQGCGKEESSGVTSHDGTELEMGKRKPQNPPPTPPFYFTDCNTPTYSASFTKGEPTNIPITKNYVNSPGGSYGAFTSDVVNGVTITAPAGTFNTGSGSVVFTATGTPVAAGFYTVWISVGSIQPCMMFFTVTNPPASGPTVDPGPGAGSTGVVNFTYKGQPAAYTTVRANDGKIWLQQNLGSPQVAFHENDAASYGDYFQWGRWDDGHQTRTSQTINGGPSLMNPSHIPSGNPNFITGTNADTKWWGIGGLASDTWSGAAPSASNGKDPCAALGAGWRLPTAAEWQNIALLEDLFGTTAAFQSNLKLTSSGDRGFQNGDIGYYWTSNAAANSYAKVFFFDNVYSADVLPTERSQGFNCRCVKD